MSPKSKGNYKVKYIFTTPNCYNAFNVVDEVIDENVQMQTDNG